ncbi:hypothetical protein BCR36DRAFT_408756 [Piromyces finnis]|uniref:Coth-domain-containing protein n=1 Tax=Piromyces finnis TaxID=1754191 RepID=A0A1Y1VLB1_9FUNG|nr:hypothetical protein BCR36DRAFT_408756 [Piromyces finnis]|eukprot:ORX59251.1 hypothetical protein BCR36DRAFT_408756 [Piromyces finnis]
MEVINGFDFNLENISRVNMDDDLYEVYYKFLERNEDFNLIRISKVFNSLKVSDSHNEMVLFDILQNASIPSDTRSIINIDEEDDIMKSFKTKNATMIFEINGSFDKVTFKLDGAYSRYFQKPGFNLKIRGKKDLYGHSQFKLRADSNDPTIMRTKLISDIHNRLGLKSISSIYVQLYINDEFMRLYTFNDDYKLSWIEEVYEYSSGCINENEEINNDTEWIEFLTVVENAKSAADLEDIFEIDHFLYGMAIDYLTGAYDHIQNTHNYYMYKQPNVTYRDIHLMEVLIFNDSARFEKILNEVISKVFNPSTLYSYIDEIKEYIKPYVILDKTPDVNGNYPGHLNTGGIDSNFSLEQWDAYSELTNGYSDMESYGLNEISNESSTETLTETSVETSIEAPTETSTEILVETPSELPTETYSDSFIETQTNSTAEPTPTPTEVEYISDDEALEVEEEVTPIDEGDSEEEDLVTATATITNEIKTITKIVTMIHSTIIN